MESIEEVKQKLREIGTMGYIPTRRPHDTGVGKTLEDFLGIKENNLKLPDIGEIELKAKRLDSGSMLTLATKAPKPRGTNRILFENYKYPDTEGFYNLHSTVYGSRYNPQGFKITVKEDRLILENKRNIQAYWPISIFDDDLKSKSDKILVVFAETKGERKTKDERFHYIEAYLLSGLNEKKFREAIKADKLKIDIRIGLFRSGARKGKYHDHGTGLRISKTHFLELYDTYEKLI